MEMENSLVTLKVYDILGKEVSTLVNENLQPGTYEVPFSNNQLPSGIYYINCRQEISRIRSRCCW